MQIYGKRRVRAWFGRKVKAQPIHRKHTLSALQRPFDYMLFRDIQVKTSTCPYDGHKNTRRGVQFHSFLISTVDGSEWQISRPGRFNPITTTPSNPLNRWLVGPRAGHDGFEQREVSVGNRIPNVQFSLSRK